jgi:hypothetical protein
MNAQHKIFASVGIVLLAATASFAQQVKTDYDRSTDFSQYKRTPGKRSRHKIHYGSTGLRGPSMAPHAAAE